MLQQTQVTTVVDYFNRFTKRFPNVATLAAADESELLKYWEGLGYYRRARQMHVAAKLIVDQYGGRFPTDFDDVLALPGIGRYTAGAILSISLDQSYPILEGNTIRLFARIAGVRDAPRSSSNQAALWDFSASLLPRKRVGDFNQALMELGALVCKLRGPLCLECPLARNCVAFEEGLQDKIPQPVKKMKYEDVWEAVAIVERNSKVLMRRCGSDERWAGLWDFPRFGLAKAEAEPGIAIERVIAAIDEEFGLSVRLESFGSEIRHAVTRYRIRLQSFRATDVGGRLRRRAGRELKWVALTELRELPLSTTGRTIAEQLQKVLRVS